MFYEGRLVTVKEKIKRLGGFWRVGVGNRVIDFGVLFVVRGCDVCYVGGEMWWYSGGMVKRYVWKGNWRFCVKGKAEGKEMVGFVMINIGG